MMITTTTVTLDEDFKKDEKIDIISVFGEITDVRRHKSKEEKLAERKAIRIKDLEAELRFLKKSK